jgi:hypothetical protein
VKVLVFDACVPGDGALENSHWMAERTRERLGHDAAGLTHPDAVRANLEAHLGAVSLRGLAVFGHGDAGRLHAGLRMQHREGLREAIDETSEAGAVYGSDGEPALDLDNLPLLRGRWCHALACNVGLSLAHRAIDAGVSCFVAYETALTPEYETDSLAASLRSHLVALATATTLNLHAGVYEETVLKARVQEAIDELETWLESDEGVAWSEGQEGFMQVAGLRALARQLRRDMVVRIAAS